VAVAGDGTNRAYGVDAAFAFFQNLEMGGYWARSDTRGLTGYDESWQGAVSYGGDKYGATASHLVVGADFNPEIGFLRRSDFAKSSASLRFSPRPAAIGWIRKLTWDARVDFFADGDGEMESRQQNGRFDVEMENSDRYFLSVTRDFERIDEPFPVASDLSIPAGRFTFTSYRATYMSGTQRRIAGNVSFQWGAFYHGSIRAVSVNQGRVVVTNHLSLEPGASLNFLETPDGESTQGVFRLRADYAFTPRMFASSLIQYNSGDRALSSNLRFRWEYAPGSEVFLVWTDERDTRRGGSGLRTRGLALKVTRLLRY